MKKTNKGFSLVELIIVIAIMAILAGAIAPALIRYIDKSRRSNDVNSAKTIKTAIETALGNESVYEYLTNVSGDAMSIAFVPGSALAKTVDLSGIIYMDGLATFPTEGINGKKEKDLQDLTRSTIASNIGEKVPKLKFRKNAADTKSKDKPQSFVACVSSAGTVYVFISATEAKSVKAATYTTKDAESVGLKGADKKDFQITPYICDEYQ